MAYIFLQNKRGLSKPYEKSTMIVRKLDSTQAHRIDPESLQRATGTRVLKHDKTEQMRPIDLASILRVASSASYTAKTHPASPCSTPRPPRGRVLAHLAPAAARLIPPPPGPTPAHARPWRHRANGPGCQPRRIGGPQRCLPRRPRDPRPAAAPRRPHASPTVPSVLAPAPRGRGPLTRTRPGKSCQYHA